MSVGQPVIMVGVDGSATDGAALRWAVRAATRQHGLVRAVSVNAGPRLGPEHDLTDDTDAVDRLIDRTRAGIPDAAPVWAVSVTGDPAVELSRLAAHADLLVVAEPEHGPLAELFLDGVDPVPCPVVVVPGSGVGVSGVGVVVQREPAGLA